LSYLSVAKLRHVPTLIQKDALVVVSLSAHKCYYNQSSLSKFTNKKGAQMKIHFTFFAFSFWLAYAFSRNQPSISFLKSSNSTGNEWDKRQRSQLVQHQLERIRRK
jgi:hypothetical protein